MVAHSSAPHATPLGPEIEPATAITHDGDSQRGGGGVVRGIAYHAVRDKAIEQQRGQRDG